MPAFTSYAHGTPCWSDVTSTDLPRAVEFYTALFGWDAEIAQEPESGGYTMFTLGGRNVAAGSPPMGEPAASYWTTYLASDDVDDTAARIRAAGGTVLIEPFDVFDAGRMTIAQDPTGATFGVWQANRHIGAELANDPGTMTWNECQTRDPEAAARFYEDVFGVEVKAFPSAGGGAASSDETVAKAQELGGTALMPGMDLPEIGRLAVLQDPTGAVFQVLQPPPES